MLEGLAFTSQQYGWIDAAKEIPGLAAAGLILVTARFLERNVWLFSSVLIAFGIFLYSMADGFPSVLAFTLVFSTGMHLWSIYGDYLVTDLSTEHDRSVKFGQVASYSAAQPLLFV